MTWHVVPRYGTNDTFLPGVAGDDQIVSIPFYSPGDPTAVQMSVTAQLAQHRLSPAFPALELLHASVAAYATDVRIPRASAYDGWTRDIVLHLPVADPDAWERAAIPFERMLRFLTGDHWVVRLRRRSLPEEAFPPPAPPSAADAACLFSGGLDSFAGALDLLARGHRAVLIGHYARGAGATSRSQRFALERLYESQKEESAPFLPMWVHAPRGANSATEITTRGRSVLFLGIGACVASALAEPRLVVPENGFISLNVPLTASRLGSFSTRTTHPHLIHLLREVITELGMKLQVDLPYRFVTKGEVLTQCLDQQALIASLAGTSSCARPGIARFAGVAGNTNPHCGYCFPCLIRRAAIHRLLGRGADPTNYLRSDLSQPLSETQRSDLRAVRMALGRYAGRPPKVSDVLVPGPLHADGQGLRAYLGVFDRGLGELRSFLDGP